ncbi:MAG: hypothetical protein WD872_17120 [Pirellulaceae bacterium]
MNPLQKTALRYNGLNYGPNYCVISDKRLFRRLRSKSKSRKSKGKSKWKLIKLHPHSGGYELWYPRNPLTGKHHPGIIASRAVAESFAGAGAAVNGMVAAHGPETKRSDGALGTCTFKTPRGNRKDRERDGTHSTGHDTTPGKLTAAEVQELLNGWEAKPNASAWGRKYSVTPQAIRYHLRRRGKLP